MRIESRGQRGKGNRELRVSPTGGETLSSHGVNWLFAGEEPAFVPPKVMRGRVRRKQTLCYPVHGLMALREHLHGHALEHDLLCGILDEFTQALKVCDRRLRHDLPLVCDSRCVFMDEDCHLHFVCVPLDGVAPGVQTSPLTLLRSLCDTRYAHYGSADDESVCGRLARFVEGENKVFSINRLLDFMEREHLVRGEAPLRLGDGGQFVLRNVGSGTVRQLQEGKPYVLGRARGCDVSLGDRPAASRRHAVVCGDGEGVVVVDQGSTNGTYVNGVRIGPMREVRLAWGETFSLAGVTFRVERG